MARKSPPNKTSAVAGNTNASRLWILRVLLIAATTVAYLPAWNGKQIWDDKAHITAPALRSLQGLKEIWFEPGATQQYYPVVHSAFWLEHKLWGDAVLPYHLVNILLHSFSAILLFQILRRLHVPGAWLAAALFVTTAILSLQARQRKAAGEKLTPRIILKTAAIGLGAGLAITIVFQEIFLVRLP